MVTKIVIAGAGGRMGKSIIHCALNMPEVKIVGAVEGKNHPDMGKDCGTIVEVKPVGVSVTSDLNAVLSRADVLIDFTFHTVVPDNAGVSASLGKAMVIGTTGLDDAEKRAVTQAAKTVPVVWAPNMSLGMNLLFAMVKKATATLGAGYKIEIDETHHIHKKDAPSGSALRLGEKAAEGIGRKSGDIMVHNPPDKNDPCLDGKIVITSHREGEVVGDHTVSFGNQGERIELTHHAVSRDAFAMGALRAAQWVINQPPGLYDMQDVLGLNR